MRKPTLKTRPLTSLDTKRDPSFFQSAYEKPPVLLQLFWMGVQQTKHVIHHYSVANHVIAQIFYVYLMFFGIVFMVERPVSKSTCVVHFHFCFLMAERRTFGFNVFRSTRLLL